MVDTKIKKQRSATTLKNYYARWMDIFWKDPELIKGLSEDVGAYICDAMRRFAECWNHNLSNKKHLSCCKSIQEYMYMYILLSQH
jgi:hypothetical protein